MPVFTRLIQTASSPEKSLKALSAPAKYNQATFARLADVNELAKDQNDQALYTLALGASTTGTQAISTKRGVVKATTSGSSTSLTITLSNSELLSSDVDKYFVQATVASSTSFSPCIRVVPMSINNSIDIVITPASGSSTAWGTVYLNYTIVKIGD